MELNNKYHTPLNKNKSMDFNLFYKYSSDKINNCYPPNMVDSNCYNYFNE